MAGAKIKKKINHKENAIKFPPHKPNSLWGVLEIKQGIELIIIPLPHHHLLCRVMALIDEAEVAVDGY